MTDSHCHLADAAYAGDLGAVVERARAAGLRAALCVLAAGDAGEAERAGRVADLWPQAWFAIGAHPHQAREFTDRLARLGADVRELIGATPRAVAIGEIGLDYHYDFSPRDIQRTVFATQVALARDIGLPVIVHTREADPDTISLLRSEGGGAVAGVFHCFSSGRELARQALDIGFHVSFSGILTFPRVSALREVAAWVPLDRILVETDCPYLAPVPYRGRRNEPAWVTRVAATLAEIRNVPVQTIDEATTANFMDLFARPRPEDAVQPPTAR
ncbi:MAG: TatD family hydrolase [Acidobacteria bacterium]|nr:TatD family hydrolase [Acidobacteriota bacterium]